MSPTTTSSQRLDVEHTQESLASSGSLMMSTMMTSPSVGRSFMRAEDELLALEGKACRPVCHRQSVMIELRNLLFADSARAPLSSETLEWLQKVQRKSCGWKGSWSQRLTRPFFSWSILGAHIQETRIWVKLSAHTPFLKKRNYEICQRTKITRAPWGRLKKNDGAVPRAVKFGDLITADHKVLSDNCESRNNHRYAIVVQDLATQWIQASPCKNKISQETQRSLQKFLEPDKPKVIYTDNSLEFGKVCEDLSWNHCTSTPHRSETNGIAERAVRRVKEGTSAVLLQSGLNESWWGRFYGMLHLSSKRHRSIIWWEDALWKTFWATIKRTDYSIWFIGWVSPFNCEGSVKKPSIWKESLTWIVPRVRPVHGVFCKGDVLIADREELETMDASEIYSKRLNAKEVIVFQGRRRTYFFNRRWTNQIIWKRSTSQTAITLNKESNFSRRERNQSIFHEVHWRFQNYEYELGCQAGETHRWWLEYRRVSEICLILGQVSHNLEEKPPDGYMWPGWD